MTNDLKTQTINIGLIQRPNPPIREHFDEEELSRLIASIKEHGIIVPLMVRPQGDKYEVIDGDRRLKAAWEAQLREVPVVVYDLDDRETHVHRMLANLDRDDTDPVSEAKYIAKTISEKILTVEEWCDKVGRSKQWVADRLAIAEMPEYMQHALSLETVPLGVALELNQIKDESTKQRYFKEACHSGMTVHAAHVSRLTVNEAIEGLQAQNVEVTEETVPEPVLVPNVKCEITGEILPITATRMVRVGIDNLNEWRRTRDV